MVLHLRQLLEQQIGFSKKSTALQPVIWVIAIIGGILAASIRYASSHGVIVTLVIILVGVLTLFGGAFIYLLLNDRDALRSEKYNISKLAIERGVIGDSQTGTPPIPDDLLNLPSGTENGE